MTDFADAHFRARDYLLSDDSSCVFNLANAQRLFGLGWIQVASPGFIVDPRARCKRASMDAYHARYKSGLIMVVVAYLDGAV